MNNANANSATPTAPGVTGLFGLIGEVVGGNVELFATSYGLNELSQSYLYEITDTLSDTSITQASSEQFATLYTDSTGQTSLRGVAFAPTPEPNPPCCSWAPEDGFLVWSAAESAPVNLNFLELPQQL